jgi:branched-chain amino acid transport system ATP-binding protein
VYGYFPILRERAAQDAGLLSGGQQQMLAISAR